jgi:hypothetical protein
VTVVTAFTIAVLLVAIALTYRQQRHWEARAHMWRQRLKSQLDVLRVLIRDAQETQQRYRETSAPSQLHADFIVRCEGALRAHFGEGYAMRVERRLVDDWLKPPGLSSNDHIFAWYDTERRIAALQDLIGETADDLASIRSEFHGGGPAIAGLFWLGIIAAIWIGLPPGLLYGLVRFVKWSWGSP